MFGGHLIAFVLLLAAPVVGGVVLVAAVAGVAQCRRSGGRVVGVGRAAAGVALAAAGAGAAYLAFVQ
jgi:hypothetical protein